MRGPLLLLLGSRVSAMGTNYWWEFQGSDCDPGKQVGSCSSAGSPADCEAACLKTQGCGGFNWPHKHLKGADCAANVKAVAGLTLYVLKDTPQGPTPPPPPPSPTRDPGASNWWYFANTDCDAGIDIGSCSSAKTPEDCKAACLATPECGGFNWPHKNFKKPDCFYNRRAYNGIDVYVLNDDPQPAPTPAPTGDKLTPYDVDNDPDALCSDGTTPVGGLFKNDETGWVLQVGGAPTLNFCISENACKMFGLPPGATPAPPPGPPGTQYYGGVWSPNCTINPDFCKFSQASLPFLCDKALGLGAVDRTYNGTLVRYRGLKILEASIQKLATLGLDKAEKVLVVGIGHGGTAAIFHADRIKGLLKKVAPNLKVYKVMPVDGIHPNYISMLDIAPYPGTHFEWYQTALQWVANTTAGPNAVAALPQGCAQANPGKEWRCLYANETLPYIETPVFAVQQLASVWDMQCMSDGNVIGNILQVSCTNHGGNYWKDQYTCTQYPDLCKQYIVKNFTVPFQTAYLNDFTRIGMDKKKGGGGFFHSCYLGNYLPATFNATGQWNLIEIGNVTMQQAVSAWWNDADGTAVHWYPDQVWDPNGQPGEYAEPATPVPLGEDGEEIGAPVAPRWTCRYMRNPSCKRFRVWY